MRTQNLFFPNPKQGKTTLLEAIYLALYDIDAVSHLQRAGLNGKKASYPEFLQNALHHKAQEQYGQFRMELEIEVRQEKRNQIQGLKICRQWYFDAKGSLKRNELQVPQAYLYQNDSYRPIEPDLLGKYLNTFALPFDYAPFFFFDGEKIVRAAENSTGLWLNSALKGLLGVTLLVKLSESLTAYRSQLISEEKNENELEKLNEAERKFSLARNELERCIAELAATEDEWMHWTSEHNRLTNLLGSGSDIRTHEDLMTQRNQIEQELAAFNDKVKHAIKSMPLAFLPRGRLKNLSEKLERERNLLNHETVVQDMQTRVDEFWNEFIDNEKVKSALGSLAEVILNRPELKAAVQECWKEVFHKPSEQCAQTVEHNYLSDKAYGGIQEEIRQLHGMPQDKIGELLAEIQQRERAKQEIEVEHELLKGTNRSEWVKELRIATSKMNAASGKLGTLRANKTAQESKCKEAEQSVERLQNNISNNNPKLLKSRRAGAVVDVIGELSHKLLQQKIDAVSDAATRVQSKLSHSKHIDKIKISSDYQIVLYGKNGEETKIDPSSGEMQILIMSLVYALSEVVGYHAPFVIDTPLARLSSHHRENLFQYWCSLPQQVMILSQDTEITPEVRQRLGNHVCCSYLVEAQVLDTAGKVAHVTPNAYFE